MAICAAAVGVILQPQRQPWTVGRFRTSDHGADAAQQIVFVDDPIGAAVPPCHRRECGVETGPFEPGNVRPVQTGRPCQKPAFWMALLDRCNSLPPDRRRQQLRLFASETRHARIDQARQPVDPPLGELFRNRRFVEAPIGGARQPPRRTRVDALRYRLAFLKPPGRGPDDDGVGGDAAEHDIHE